MRRRGFTLIEMLVVVGIIATLVALGISGYAGATKRAQQGKALELVSQVHTALVQMLAKNDSWPRVLVSEGSSGNGEFTPEAGGILAKRGAITLTYDTESRDGTTYYVLTGPSKFGILSPWAADYVKQKYKSKGLSLSTKIPTGGTIRTHRLHFAIDDDYDGIVEVNGEGSENKGKVRASACVWCAGRDGVFGTKDDLRSWTEGQEIKE